MLLNGTEPGRLADGHRFHDVQQYEAERLDWQRYAAVLAPIHVDQRHLSEIAGKIEAYLEAGGTVLCNGHIVRPFLRELSPFVPLMRPKLSDLTIHRAAAHPLFDGVTSDALTRRKGVAGFYARGSNPAPDGALVLNTIGPDRLPVDWIATRPSGGRLFVHSGNDIWSFFGRDNAAGRAFAQRLFDWLAATAAVRPEAVA